MPVTHGLAVQLDESASRILQWFLEHKHFPSSDEAIQEALHSLYREFHQGPGLPLSQQPETRKINPTLLSPDDFE